MTEAFDRMTASDIAKLADVDISTVSNWRKRYKDKEPRFPSPVDENAARPVFSGPEIRAWLRQQNAKYAALLDEAEKTGRAADIIRSWRYALNPIFANPNTDVALDEVTLMFITRIQGGEFEYSDSQRSGYKDLSVYAHAEHLTVTIPDEAAESIEAFFKYPITDATPAELIEAAAADLDHSSRWRRSTDAVDAGDNLLSLLAGLVHEGSDSVLDFACGTGGLLKAVATTVGKTHIVGIESEWLQASIADARLTPYEAEVIDGDILAHDVLEGRSFDAVVCVPPFGLDLPGDMRQLARRMRYGQVRGNADAAWLQLTVTALAPNGEGYLVLPQSVTSDAKSDGIRRELVREGLVSAVVALPQGAHPDTRVATDLWVLKKPDEDRRRNAVLFIDASDIDPTSAGAYDHLRNPIFDWQDGNDLPPNDLAAMVLRAMDLMDQNVNLSPRYWVTRGRPAANPREVITAVADTFNRARGAVDEFAEIGLKAPSLHPATASMTSLRQLRQEESIELLRPDLRGRTEGAEDLTPRLTVAVAEAIRAGTYQPTERTLAAAEDDGITLGQEVLIWASQQDRRVRATVCSFAGLRMTSAVQVIRCHGINPHYVALCLESSRNSALVVGSGVARPQVMDMDLPDTTPAQADVVAHTLQVLRLLEAGAHEVLTAVEVARSALADALGSGQVEVDITGAQS
jgi:SAM-dependent methyltransferase